MKSRLRSSKIIQKIVQHTAKIALATRATKPEKTSSFATPSAPSGIDLDVRGVLPHHRIHTTEKKQSAEEIRIRKKHNLADKKRKRKRKTAAISELFIIETMRCFHRTCRAFLAMFSATNWVIGYRFWERPIRMLASRTLPCLLPKLLARHRIDQVRSGKVQIRKAISEIQSGACKRGGWPSGVGGVQTICKQIAGLSP